MNKLLSRSHIQQFSTVLLKTTPKQMKSDLGCPEKFQNAPRPSVCPHIRVVDNVKFTVPRNTHLSLGKTRGNFVSSLINCSLVILWLCCSVFLTALIHPLEPCHLITDSQNN